MTIHAGKFLQMRNGKTAMNANVVQTKNSFNLRNI
ncbi:MAG: hypothetical protein QG594_296, partial [Bacteroidota bacterium]|nr:hypothetical protein [Bacteroidota bacterium]